MFEVFLRCLQVEEVALGSSGDCDSYGTKLQNFFFSPSISQVVQNLGLLMFHNLVQVGILTFCQLRSSIAFKLHQWPMASKIILFFNLLTN
jgi:hypothetical protein